MALVDIARAIMNPDELERTGLAEELCDCAGTENFTIIGTSESLTTEEMSGALLLWANHAFESLGVNQ